MAAIIARPLLLRTSSRHISSIRAPLPSTLLLHRNFTTTPRRLLPTTYFPAEAAAQNRKRVRLYSVLFVTTCGFLGFINGAIEYFLEMRDYIKYSDKESLTQFKPADSKQAEIEQFLTTHPLAVELRANPAFTESRPTLKVKEEYRNGALTSGVLAGPGRIVVPPFVWVEEGGKSLVTIMYLGNEVCGYPGLIHGGVLATLLDEGLARCSFAALPNKLAMTANLNVNYRKPSPADSYVVLRAKTTKVEGRKAWVEGYIETLPKEAGEEPVVLVEATALMIEPKHAEKLTNLVGTP